MSSVLTNQFHFDTVVPGNPAPLYGADFKPLIDKGGPVCVSHTHAARRLHLNLEKAGLYKPNALGDEIAKFSSTDAGRALGTQSIYFASTDVIVVTADGYALLSQRSNRAAAAQGHCIHTAGGSLNVIDGRPESVEACGIRETREETGLAFESMKLIGSGPVNARLAVYDLKTTDGKSVPGVVAYASHQLVAKSPKSIMDLVHDVSLNSEHVGMIAINVTQLDRLLAGRIVILPYFQSSGGFVERVIAPVFEKQTVHGLEDLRRVVQQACPMTQDERAQRGNLAATNVVVSRKSDFEYFQNSLAVIAMAFLKTGFRPNEATRRFAGLYRMPELRQSPQQALSASMAQMRKVSSERFSV